MKPLLCLLFLAALCVQDLPAQDSDIGKPKPARKEKPAEKKPDPLVVPEFLWTGSWESEHNLSDLAEVKLTIPKANLAFRLEVLDRRPASSFEVFRESFGGETAGKALTQPGLGLYHLSTGSRLLYGVLDSYGLSARVRNIWIRGAPYVQSRTESSAELKTAPSSTAVPQFFAGLDTNGIDVGQGRLTGFVSAAFNDDPDNRNPVVDAGLGYILGKGNFNLEGFYTGQTLPERKSSSWFNEKPALPERDTRLFAGSASFSVPAFGAAVDFSRSETFAFGRDYYGSLGLRFGDKPWRFSLAFDAAGSRYIDSAGANPGAGFRSAARLERWGKRSGLFRLTALLRGPDPLQGNISGIVQSFDRVSGELYYRFPAVAQKTGSSFGITRFSFSAEHDARDEKKVLDSGGVMAALKIGPVNTVSEGGITWLNGNKSSGLDETGFKVDSFKLSQSVSWNIKIKEPVLKAKSSGTEKVKNTGKKNPLTLLLSAKIGYAKTIKKEGIWNTSLSASLRSRKNRLTIKAASAAFPKKWEYTISWRLLF